MCVNTLFRALKHRGSICVFLFAVMVPALSAEGGTTTAPGSSIPGQRIEGNPHTYVRYTIPEPQSTSAETPLPAIRITYTSRHLGYAEGSIQLHRGTAADTITLLPRFGTHRVYLYPGLSGAWPESMDIHPADETRIVDVSLVSAPGPENPLPADTGTMLAYGREHWRRDTFELFSWNLAPSILVYVTRDYAVQARVFKRLAFFVEKPGFSGSLHSNEAIAHRHGWNAHDYRAEDLARFFQKAAEENFTLNPEEEELLSLLLANGVLRNNSGTILPGTGSVLSISLETPFALRAKFLVHEAFHGLFFTSPRFRTACLDSWRALSAAEQDFWKFFLRHRTYNVENEFLLVNEFMAFLMQQKKSELDWYYKQFIADELKAAYPARAAEFDRFYSDYPDTFHLSAARVERAAETLFGVRAGDLNCLVY